MRGNDQDSDTYMQQRYQKMEEKHNLYGFTMEASCVYTVYRVNYPQSRMWASHDVSSWRWQCGLVGLHYTCMHMHTKYA